MLWAQVCGCGVQRCPPGLHALWGLRAAGVVGGRPRGGWPATVVRGVWCQALSLPRLPAPWGGQPGFRDPCVRGVVGAGVETQHRPHSVRPCRPALLAVRMAEGHPRGGCLPPSRGASEVRRSPSPDCAPTGRAVGVRHPRAVGAGVWVWGPNTVSLTCMPCGGCVMWGWWGPSPRGWACHRCEGRLVSGAVPPPAARPQGRAAGVSRPVCPGCGRCGLGTQHRPHSVRPCGPALLAVGVAEGRSRGGAFHRCEGRLWSDAPPPRTAHPLGGCWGPPPTCCGRGCVGVGAQHCPLGLHALWGLRAAGVSGGRPRGGWPATVVRGVPCQALSLSRPPALWGGRPWFCDPCIPGAVGAGVGTQQRLQSVRPCGPALLAVGVAEGRPRGGCLLPL